jgi:hypothetical protein
MDMKKSYYYSYLEKGLADADKVLAEIRKVA